MSGLTLAGAGSWPEAIESAVGFIAIAAAVWAVAWAWVRTFRG